MYKARVRIICRLLATASPMLIAQHCYAQASTEVAADKAGANTAGQSFDSGEIVVTAQKRVERLRDVPVSVTVATGESLQKQNISSLSELSVRLPGIRVATTPNSGLLNIRGIGSGSNVGFEQSVGTFVDGLYRGRSRALAAGLFDLERVEVLRGPQTTFFGNNVIAGALNIVTRKPDWQQAFNASALYTPASHGYALEAGMTLPVSDTLSVRLAGRVYGQDGWAFNEKLGRTVPHDRDWIGRIAIAWKPSSNFRSDIRFDRGRLRDRGSPVTEVLGCPPDPAYGAPRGTCLRYVNSGKPIDDELNFRVNNFATRNTYDFAEVEWTNALDLGAGTITAVSGYFHHDADVLSDAAPVGVDGLMPNTASATPIDNIEAIDQYSQELRFQTDPTRPINFMVGAYYAREDLDSSHYGGLYLLPLGTSAAPTYNANTPIVQLTRFKQQTTTKSAFGSLTAALTSSLKVDLGLRYSEVHKEVSRSLLYGAGGYLPGPGYFVLGPDRVQPLLTAATNNEAGDYASPQRTDRKLMPSVKLRYQIDPDVLAYVSYTNGFKAGGYAASTRKYELRPETVNAYEAGIKASLFDRRLFTSLALFRSDYKDLQESSQNVVGASVVVVITNAARSRSQGVEFGANLRVSDAVTLFTDVSYVDSKYLDFRSAQCTVLATLANRLCTQDMSGKQRGFAPKFSGNVGASIVLPVASNQLRFEPLVYFTSRYYQSANLEPLSLQKGFAKADLRVSYGPQDRAWEIAVIGKNLTNIATASFRNQFVGAAGSVFAYPEPPRLVSVQVSAKF